MKTIDCGCHIEAIPERGDTEKWTRRVVFCQMHEAAEELVKACQHALTIAREYDETGFAGTIVLKRMLTAALQAAGFAAPETPEERETLDRAECERVGEQQVEL